MQKDKGRQGEPGNFTVIIPEEFYASVKAIGRSLGAIAMRLGLDICRGWVLTEMTLRKCWVLVPPP
jgi:hypothetical protein